MPLAPLRFKPILKPKVWGGHLLAEMGKPAPPDESIGESWELADLPDSISEGRSRIDGGPCDGQLLQTVLAENGKALLGRANLSPEGGFPLLLKFLDANENLSVQVHPDEAYVAKHPEAHLKSEAWYILEAKPGSVIYAGVQPGVDAAQFKTAIEKGDLVDLLVSIPAVPGDCHYLPSGTCHALGEGVLVAEVQTPSDTTFRVWDWGRTDREIHVEAAMACIDFSGRKVTAPPPPAMTSADRITTRFVEVPFFTIDRLQSNGTTSMDMPTKDLPEAIMVLDGNGHLNFDNDNMSLERGDTVLLPADRPTCTIVPQQSLDMLHVTLGTG